MTERKAFEEHYGIPIEQRRAPSAGGYAGRDFQLMWAAWQASRRDALEECEAALSGRYEKQRRAGLAAFSLQILGCIKTIRALAASERSESK